MPTTRTPGRPRPGLHPGGAAGTDGPGGGQAAGAVCSRAARLTSYSLSRADGGGIRPCGRCRRYTAFEDGERDVDGNVNCEVTGFVLSGQGLLVVYVAATTRPFEWSPNCPGGTGCRRGRALRGAARVTSKFRGRPPKLDSRRAAAAAAALGAKDCDPRPLRRLDTLLRESGGHRNGVRGGRAALVAAPGRVRNLDIPTAITVLTPKSVLPPDACAISASALTRGIYSRPKANPTGSRARRKLEHVEALAPVSDGDSPEFPPVRWSFSSMID